MLRSKAVRDSAQRRFDSARRKRADVYSVYIEAVECGSQIGGTPAITIWLPDAVAVTDDALVVPYNACMVAIDGETQTEARFLLRQRKDGTGDNPFAVTIYHGITEEHAQQIVHDYNRHAKPINEKMAASLNHAGPLTSFVDTTIQEAGIGKQLINRAGNKPGKKQVASFRQAMYFGAGYAMADEAMKRDAGYWLDALNDPTSPVVFNGKCSPSLRHILHSAKQDSDISAADKIVWQCAGILTARDRSPESLNWAAGHAAYRSTRGGKGRPRVSQAHRIEKIVASM
jgi:hypothetical protein